MLLDLKLVVRLQEIDNRLAELAREIAALPKHIAEIEKKLGAHERKLDADRAALAANQKERKKCETDIPVQDQKISKLKDQMLSTKTNDQYRAFQKEIRRLEDRILELMGECEPLEKNVKAAEAALTEEKAQVEGEKAVARERTAVDRKAASELETERASIAKEVTAATYKQYERVRKGRRGIAVAEVVEGRCTACHMVLRPQYFQDVKRTETLLFCESCQRILYYNPPQAFDDLAGEEGGARVEMGE